MIKFFSNNKIIFLTLNLFLVFLYLFPGSLPGKVLYGDLKIQPQITPDFIVSSNHFYVFLLISVIGFFTFVKSNQIRILMVYLILLSIVLEFLHIVIPERSFQWSDLFGNLFGVIVVILINKFINKHEVFKK
tara:strand:+ start:483 stop:878 length:396 start_codon:yes stop_codon:yes gene_type:complete